MNNPFLENRKKQEREHKIRMLENRLAQSDYKIIKSYEYELAGLELPYDIETLHAERQAIRDQINALRDGDEK